MFIKKKYFSIVLILLIAIILITLVIILFDDRIKAIEKGAGTSVGLSNDK